MSVIIRHRNSSVMVSIQLQYKHLKNLSYSCRKVSYSVVKYQNKRCPFGHLRLSHFHFNTDPKTCSGLTLDLKCLDIDRMFIFVKNTVNHDLSKIVYRLTKIILPLLPGSPPTRSHPYQDDTLDHGPPSGHAASVHLFLT